MIFITSPSRRSEGHFSDAADLIWQTVAAIEPLSMGAFLSLMFHWFSIGKFHWIIPLENSIDFPWIFHCQHHSHWCHPPFPNCVVPVFSERLFFVFGSVDKLMWYTGLHRLGRVWAPCIQGFFHGFSTLCSMLNHVGNPTIDLPFADGLYHPFTVIFGIIYHWVYHITWLDFPTGDGHTTIRNEHTYPWNLWNPMQCESYHLVI